MYREKKYLSFLLILVISILYYLFAYQLERSNFQQLLLLYSGLMLLSYWLFHREKQNPNVLFAVGIGFRLIFLLATPNLSQDFYRFIWDGRMMLEGFNPFISLPETFVQTQAIPIDQGAELYTGMGALNGSHFTNYPPVNQLNFLIAALFSKTSILGAIIGLRIQIILADIGIFLLGKRMLKKLNLPSGNIFLYLLNPFVIIELTGNLHFEPVMLFFLVWSLCLLLQKNWFASAVVLGCSVSVKLIPLLLVPVLFQFFIRNHGAYGRYKFVGYGLVVLLTNLLFFLPFLSSELVSSYTNSVGLWFRSFEFNASLYYLAREVGFWFSGYNQIALLGKLMPALAGLLILGIAFFRNNRSNQKLLEALLLALSLYYFTTTTVHPWYMASLVLLGIFTRFKFPLIWSAVIILTYQAYSTEPWQENLWMVALEYLVVYTAFLYEVVKGKTLSFRNKEVKSAHK